jgi:hypothetical protein
MFNHHVPVVAGAPTQAVSLLSRLQMYGYVTDMTFAVEDLLATTQIR